MSLNLGGIDYENKIRRSVEEANLPWVKIIKNETMGAFNSHEPDLKLLINEKLTNFEVKCLNAQMGETSFTYRPDRSPMFIPATERMDPDISDLIVSEKLIHITDSIHSLFEFLHKEEPVVYHSLINSLPLNVTKRAWTKAVENKMILPLNGKIQFDERIIEHHYNLRNVFYIQIEKLGLFYLKENPLDLPVPRLSGDVDIEIRVKRSGSKMNKSIGEASASVVLRASGRLKFKGISPYSLDDPKKISEIFKNPVDE